MTIDVRQNIQTYNPSVAFHIANNIILVCQIFPIVKNIYFEIVSRVEKKANRILLFSFKIIL